MGSDTYIAVSEETRDLARERKEQYGMSYDAYFKLLMRQSDVEVTVAE